jgi:hypothetical protein
MVIARTSAMSRNCGFSRKHAIADLLFPCEQRGSRYRFSAGTRIQSWRALCSSNSYVGLAIRFRTVATGRNRRSGLDAKGWKPWPSNRASRRATGTGSPSSRTSSITTAMPSASAASMIRLRASTRNHHHSPGLQYADRRRPWICRQQVWCRGLALRGRTYAAGPRSSRHGHSEHRSR